MILLVLLLAAIGGCSWCSDVTDSARVRAGGVVGRCFVLTRELRLIKTDYSRWPMLLSSDDSDEGGSAASPTLAVGTRLTVVKVEQCGYPVVMDFTLARVENGAMAGTLVATNRAGIGFSAVQKDSPDFEPCPPAQRADPGSVGG
jgi:hypothetical protein